MRPSGAAVDVAVIGGGIVGCATAAFLAGAGASVLLVEAGAIAGAASGRNSGVVQHPLDPILAELYRATVRLLRDLEAEVPERFSLPSQPAGLLYVSESAEPARHLTAELRQSHPGLEPTVVEGEELRRLEPSLAADLAACRLAIGYPVGPARATLAYAALAGDRGARVEVGAPATLAWADGRLAGVTIAGELRVAGSVVVAAGPWTPEVVDPTGRWRPIRPMWGAVAEVRLGSRPGHVLEELEIDETIEPSGAPGAAEAHPVAPVAFSLVTADGRSVVGSTFSVDEPDDVALVPALIARAGRFVPAVRDAAVVGSRRCARPVSLDGRPLLGRVPDVEGLLVAAGHGPWGISTGAGSARLVADLVLGRATAPPPELDPARLAS